MPFGWTAENGQLMISDCYFCRGTHAWDINACPAPDRDKWIKDCKLCGGEHPWDSQKCPEKDNTNMIYHCLFCGGDHEKDTSQCPANKEKCERCGETGHFSSECERLANAVKKNEEKSTP